MAYPKKIRGADLYNIAKRNGVPMRTISKYSNQPNINSGLQVWWKFDETTGSSAADSSGNGKTGTLTNMENGDWGAGKINNCLTFDGTNEYVVNSSIGSLSGTCSVSLWMKRNGAPSSNLRLADVAVAAASGIQICVQGTTGYANVDGDGYGGLAAEMTANVNVCDNAWHHIAVTRTGTAPSIFKLYVDGVLQVTSNNAGNTVPTLTRLFVGCRAILALYFGGQIDDVRVYNRVLSSDDVTALYNVTAP
jgi:hypothetical protein